MIKNKNWAYALYLVIFLVFWNLLEFLICRFITNSAFTFTVPEDILLPLILGAVTGYLFIYRKKH